MEVSTLGKRRIEQGSSMTFAQDESITIFPARISWAMT